MDSFATSIRYALQYDPTVSDTPVCSACGGLMTRTSEGPARPGPLLSADGAGDKPGP